MLNFYIKNSKLFIRSCYSASLPSGPWLGRLYNARIPTRIEKKIFLMCSCLMTVCSFLVIGVVLHCPDHDFTDIRQNHGGKNIGWRP
ncbi:unnamed protein product, partial [Nesidiocoris tenuis]